MDNTLKEYLEGIKRWVNAMDDPQRCDLKEGIMLTQIELDVEKIKILDRLTSAIEKLVEKGLVVGKVERSGK